MCLNDECIDGGHVKGKVSVGIDFNSGVVAVDMNVDEVPQTISVECDVKKEELTTAMQSDEDGFVIRVIIAVDDEELADTIVVKV